jgi:hypothetical protein
METVYREGRKPKPLDMETLSTGRKELGPTFVWKP